MSMVIPLHIQISLGAPAPNPLAVDRSVAPTAPPAEEAFLLDEDYASRPGYDPNYLAVEVPMPTLTDAAMEKVSRDLTSDEEDDHILRYHHFSVVMNRERRMQFFSACNTTRDPNQRGALSRKALGRDRWILDPRIPKRDQIQSAELYAGTEFDLGHVVRREDAYWGADETNAEHANFDTFHYTNATPQHEAFNRSNLKGRWGLLENHIGEQLKSQDLNMSILAGPVFRKDDPVIHGVRIPVDFWKVVAALDDAGELAVFAFALSQRDLVASMPEEGFTTGAFRADQRSLRYIESVTDVRFAPVLHDADVLHASPNESLRLTSLESIRIRPAQPNRPLHANGA
jgi:endonuclease G